MSFLREFHYPNISQRKIIDFNTLFSFLLIGFLFSDISLLSKYYFFYFPVIRVILISGLGGLFIGNLLGRLLYAKISKFRLIYILSDILFVTFSAFYILRNYIIPGEDEPLLSLFFMFKYSLPILIFIATFMVGLKINYFLKISCGDFIDRKKGIIKFIGFSLSGISAGIIISGIQYFFVYPLIFIIALPALLLPTIFLINLPYNPSPLYAKDYEGEEDLPLKSKHRDNLIFTYLNFSYIIIYLYMGFSSIIKFYGDLSYIKLTFIAITLLAILIGYLIGKYIKISFWHIYTESIFPVAFLLFLILLLNYQRDLPFYYGILLFTPAAIVFGFSLNHTISNIIINYDNKMRFTIIEFSTLILPAPILISLSLINFTNFWYYILISILILSNIIIPAIYIVNMDIKGYKKAAYFFFSLFVLPLFIFIIVFFKIPLDNNIYVTSIDNFDELKNVNYNALFIKNKATVKMYRFPIFNISDSIIRNYKRSLAPLSLYQPDDKEILFIDGNQKFFRNPGIAYFNNSTCLDILSEKNVDHNRLPLSGIQKYIPDNDFLLFYLNKKRNKYFAIVDIPNIIDQNLNYFRFSEEYYAIIKKKLSPKGIFVQIFNTTDCRPDIFSFSARNLHKSFKKHNIYFFSDILVIMSSNDEKAFEVKESNFTRMVKFFHTHEALHRIYLNELHIISHLIFTEISDLTTFAKESHFKPVNLLTKSDRLLIDQEIRNKYIKNNRRLLELIEKSFEKFYFLQTIKNSFANNDAILTLLKETELAEAEENYKDETELLIKLKKHAEYRMFLQQYVFKILKYKEDYYYDVAVRLEKNKRWEEAKKLYRAVLSINNNNFNANYRIGLLYITLQDIENSFNYLKHAMKLNKDHPKVLYQMGVLFFSSGKINEAIDYFKRALQQNVRGGSVYRYLGLCHEKLGKLYEAERYYSKAVIADPNDRDAKHRLKNIKSEIKKEKKKWEMPRQKNEFEAEQDTDMPLPISKSAYEVRLKDEDTSLPVFDSGGDEIELESKGTEKK